jgi:hypothetical protein
MLWPLAKWFRSKIMALLLIAVAVHLAEPCHKLEKNNYFLAKEK